MINSDTLRQLKAAARRLGQFASNITSQSGEDGILAHALSCLPVQDRWCVEFGAWDGKYLSNTFTLVATQAYKAVLIESDPRKFECLMSGYEYPERLTAINASVGFTANDGLDSLLSPYAIPRNFDLLSIDIDGNDYHVWNTVKEYRPKLVLIEYNPTIANCVPFIQLMEPATTQGSSAAALVALANRKRYQLIAVTRFNLLFVDEEYFERFDIPDNSLELMRDDTSCPHIFVTYDGIIHLYQTGHEGLIYLPWHRLEVREPEIQYLPEDLRAYPLRYTQEQQLKFTALYGELP